jgi:hypothetical protein
MYFLLYKTVTATATATSGSVEIYVGRVVGCFS